MDFTDLSTIPTTASNNDIKIVTTQQSGIANRPIPRSEKLARQKAQALGLNTDTVSELAFTASATMSAAQLEALIYKAVQFENETESKAAYDLIAAESELVARFIDEAREYINKRIRKNNEAVDRVNALAASMQDDINNWYKTAADFDNELDAKRNEFNLSMIDRLQSEFGVSLEDLPNG